MQTREQLTISVKDGKVFVNGGQLNHGASLKLSVGTVTYLSRSKMGKQIKFEDASGVFVGPAYSVEREGVWTFEVRNAGDRPYFLGRRLDHMELEPTVRRILRQHNVVPHKAMIIEVGNEDMRAQMHSNPRALRPGLSTLAFVTDGTEVVKEGFNNLNSSMPDTGRISNATFCVQYSTTLDRHGKPVRWIENVQIRNQEVVSPVVFEKAISKIMNPQVQPDIQVAAGSAAPEPGKSTLIGAAFEAAGV